MLHCLLTMSNEEVCIGSKTEEWKDWLSETLISAALLRSLTFLNFSIIIAKEEKQHKETALTFCVKIGGREGYSDRETGTLCRD